jgi:hypothetical protein
VSGEDGERSGQGYREGEAQWAATFVVSHTCRKKRVRYGAPGICGAISQEAFLCLLYVYC